MACGNCAPSSSSCNDRQYCAPLKPDPVAYQGTRFTADCFDCALQLSTDTYSACSYDCLYCFSNYLVRNPETKASLAGGTRKPVGAMSPAALENILDLARTPKEPKEGRRGPGGNEALSTSGAEVFREYLRNGGNGRRVIQWGALGDPFDNIERWQRVGLQFIDLFQKYDQPTRVSSKGGTLLQDKEYLAAIAKKPHLFWFAFSIITIDDEVLAQVDRMAPSATDRLKAMKALTSLGCKASLRFRPILKNVSDRTRKHPHAWRDLLRASREAGAEAVSMEFVFVPGTMKPNVQTRWDMIEKVTGFPYRRFYKATSDKFSACLRTSRWWKEDLTHAIREEAHRLGMTFAISDPHWKELNDTENCCGMRPDDPVFGKWETKQAAGALVRARQAHEAGGPALVHYDDVVPDWARKVPAQNLVCVTGPKGVLSRTMSFADYHHRHIWNDPNSARGPRVYFGGVLEVHGKDANGDLVYKYVGQQRRHQDFGWEAGQDARPGAASGE